MSHRHTKIGGTQPQAGDSILFCGHAILGRGRIELPGTFHWFKFLDGDIPVMEDFKRPDGSEGKARLMAVCGRCLKRHSDPGESVRQDGIWPDGQNYRVRESEFPACVYKE